MGQVAIYAFCSEEAERKKKRGNWACVSLLQRASLPDDRRGWNLVEMSGR